MSSSNLAVRMEHTASDLLSHPPRPMLRVVTSNEQPRCEASVPEPRSRTGSSSFAIRASVLPPTLIL